jgi:hypothetical protein
MRKLLLASALLFVSPIFALGADILGWMGDFREKPTEATFRQIEQNVEKEASKLDGGKGEGFVLALFLGRASKQNGWPIKGSSSVSRVAAKIASDGRKIDAYLADEQQLNAGKIYLRWAEFFATGDTSYLDKIVSFAGRALPKDDPALANVISVTNGLFKIGSGRFPVVTDYVKRSFEDPAMQDKKEYFEECLGSGPMTRVVSRFVLPEMDANSFAAKPKTAYIVGKRYARIEEEPDLALKLHGLVIMNGRDGWMANLLAEKATHITDPGPTYGNHFPLVPMPKGEQSRGRDFEMGSELEFMKSRGVKPKDAEFLDRKADLYETTVDGLTLRVFTDPKAEVPRGVEVSEEGKLLAQIIYETYETNLPFRRELFLPPPGIQISEPAAKRD